MPAETLQLATQFRSAAFDRAALDLNARTIELAFSSEAPVERGFGIEVLDHSPGACDVRRLNAGGPLLVDHDTGDQVGVVESARIDADRRGRAVVRFGNSQRAQEIFQDVQDGIRRLVSVGYRLHKLVTDKVEMGVETLRATSWEPLEISLVAVPADASVGVGRAADTTAPCTVTRTLPLTMPAEITPDTTPAPAPAPAAPSVEVVRAEAKRLLSAELSRRTEISALGTRAGMSVESINSAIENEATTVEAFRAKAFDFISTSHPISTPDLSRSEQKDFSKFSLARALGRLLDNQGLDGIEREICQEGQREMQGTSVGYRGNLVLPTSFLRYGQRDMTVTGGSGGNQGGTFVQTSLGSFIELLYARMVLRDLGAQFLGGLTGNVDFPKLATGAAGVKKSEVAAATESSPTTAKVSASPKRLPTYVEISKQLLRQNSPDTENIVRNDLARALALGMEAGAIAGGGTDEPTGILSTSGIGSVAGGTNGAAPTWAHIVALETEVSIDNADLGALGYLTNPKVRGKLKGTEQFATTNGMPVWKEGATPLNGYRAGVTTQVPGNLTKGTASGVASAIIFGNFADLIICQWGGIDIMVNPYIKDDQGLVRITADTYYDSVVRHAESFAAMADALTA